MCRYGHLTKHAHGGCDPSVGYIVTNFHIVQYHLPGAPPLKPKGGAAVVSAARPLLRVNVPDDQGRAKQMLPATSSDAF